MIPGILLALQCVGHQLVPLYWDMMPKNILARAVAAPESITPSNKDKWLDCDSNPSAQEDEDYLSASYLFQRPRIKLG